VFDVVPIGSVIATVCAVLAVVPIRRPRSLATASWVAGNFPNELPFIFLLLVVGPTAVTVVDGDLSTRGKVSVSLSALVVVALAIIITRALRTRAVVEAALAAALGNYPTRPLRRRRRWLRILFIPWPLRPRTVTRTANVAYGDRRGEQLLDVYRHRSQPADAPTMIHLHGGRFRWGRKSREALSLLFRLG
jgi:hypothetical protein